METVECIKTRRSFRSFLDKEVSDDLIKQLIELGKHAPSACNTQGWEFVVVKNESVRKELSTVHAYSGFCKVAPVVIVVCYDKGRSSFSPSNILGPSACVQNILLGVNNFGLSACWVYVKDFDDEGVEDKVKAILKIPENVGVLCMIPIGYSDQKPYEKKLREVEIRYDSWDGIRDT